jgi:hypothetical protein
MKGITFGYCCLVFFLWSLPMMAQLSQGTVTGVVQDATGAVVPDATVTVVNEQTQSTRTTQASSAGLFSLPGLPVGNYDVSVSKNGFQEFRQTGIVLHPTQVATVNVLLAVGGVSTQVQVSSAVAGVETAESSVSSEVSGEQAATLPLNGRNFESLSALMPGVVNMSPGVAQNVGSLNQTSPMSVNGLSASGSFYTLDGIWNENTGNISNLTVTPNPDTIQEVRVLQNNYGVQYSLIGANVVLVETKSGTSQFHGNVFEYFRNTDLNARNYFSLNVPTLQQNIYGYTLGGPLFIPKLYNTKRKKTFFFVSEQWVDQNIGSVLTGATPTAAMRAGLFSQSIMDPQTGAPFPQNTAGLYQIPANRINPSALALMNALYPLPNNPAGGFNNYLNSNDQTNRQRDDEFKVEHDFNDKIKLMAEYFDEQQTYTYPYEAYIGSPFSTSGVLATAPNELAQVQLVSVLSKSMVNTASIALNRLINNSNGSGLVYLSQVPGYNQSLPYVGGLGSDRLPQISLSQGYSSAGVPNSIPLAPASDWEGVVTDDWSWVRGQHFLEAGINVVRGGKTQDTFNQSNGAWSFSGQFTGNPVADYLLGDAASLFDQSARVNFTGRYTIASPYIQDRWVTRDGVTITAGLRFEYLPNPHGPAGDDSTFLPTQFNPATVPVVNADGTITPTATYDPLNGIGINGQNGVPLNLTTTSPWFLAPSVGFAWDVFGNGSTAVRGGYGITYNRAPFSTDCSYQCAGSYPQISSVTLTNPSFPIAVGTGTSVLGAPSLIGQILNLKPGQIQNYSLSLERRIGQTWYASAAYAGDLARHMGVNQNINAPGPYGQYDFNPILNANTVSSSVFAPYQGYASITMKGSSGVATWNALELNLRHPVGHNLFLSANYTWSHDLTDVRGTKFFTGGGTPQNSYNLFGDYGNANVNVPQVFAASVIWNLPWFNERKGIQRALLGGWRYSDITTIQSGFSFDPGLSIALPGLATRPNRAPGVRLTGPKTVHEWFNTAAFTTPLPGYYGNAGAGIITGPAFVNFDMAGYKDFAIRENTSIEFRGELFNIFNHTNFNALQTSYGAGNFGALTGAADPRIVEFALRLQF